MSVHVHYHIIGQNIAQCRKERGLTQEQLAEYAGICQQFLSRLERGKGIPSVETILALCDALDVGSESLLTRSATHDFNIPSRLRSDGSLVSSFTENPCDDFLYIIHLEDLPIVDLELPDTDLDV